MISDERKPRESRGFRCGAWNCGACDCILYEKLRPRKGRKMGHLSAVAIRPKRLWNECCGPKAQALNESPLEPQA